MGKILQIIYYKGLMSRIYEKFLRLSNKKINNSVTNKQKIGIDISIKRICK